MRKLLVGAILPVLAAAVFFVPQKAFAGDADCSPLPAGITDLSEYAGDDTGVPEGTFLGVYGGTIGEEYTFDCAVTDGGEPAMVVITGGDLVSWEYNDSTQRVEVVVDFTGYDENIEFGAPASLSAQYASPDPFGLAIVWPAATEEDFGPPAEMIGSWMATNTNSWNLIPPEEDAPFFGFELNGPAGSTIFFHMFITDETIAYLGALQGKELEVGDLALYLGEEQASVNITEVEGGALVEITIVFKQFATNIGAASSTVGKEVTVRKKAPISLAAKKAHIKKGKRTRLYGWTRVGNKNVYLAKRLKKSDPWRRIKAKKSGGKGYFQFWVHPKKTAYFRAKVKLKKKQLAKQKITVS
ncbi:MAG: hypothetical protein ABIG66_02895 [Candidatus Kerfeldbacteria bacterium]